MLTAIGGSEDEDLLGAQGLLDSILLAEWEDRSQQGLFRYDVTACPTKDCPRRVRLHRTVQRGPCIQKAPDRVQGGPGTVQFLSLIAEQACRHCAIWAC